MPLFLLFLHIFLSRSHKVLCRIVYQFSGNRGWTNCGSSLTPLGIQLFCEGIVPRHSTNQSSLQIHSPATNALLFLFLLQFFLKSVRLLVCSFKIVQIYQFQSLFYINIASLKLINQISFLKENLQAFQIQFQGKLSFFKAMKVDLKLFECMVVSLESKNLYSSI